MSDAQPVLMEIGTEELPPRALPRLVAALADSLRKELEQARIGCGEIASFATPRRLALQINSVAAQQPDQEEEKRGPALAAAFADDGQPTRAAQGFARSCGVAIEQLDRLETSKGSWLAYRFRKEGAPTESLLPDMLSRALSQLPIPKRMRWGSHTDEFVRPVHWLVLLYGNQVVDCEILGQRAGRTTYGHRFHHPGGIELQNAGDYAALLREPGYVIPDFKQRRKIIGEQTEAAAREAGGQALMDEALLDEVTSLVEWPRALTGHFDKKFLELPQEVLVTTMKGNQKYFPLVDHNGTLMPSFITISNIDSRDPAVVVAGNERVIRPRLEDAAFFWARDCRQDLASRIPALASVVFQKQLGSLHDKTSRVEKLARQVALQIGSDPELAARAALLGKTDLLTEMVGEFPQLQGVMGRYYGRRDGEPEAVCVALDQQYMPRFSGDATPDTATGQCLAIADRIDTVTGIFGIGQAPTGEKDPFGLRRATLGILRTVIERDLDLDLRSLLSASAAQLPGDSGGEELAQRVFDFMLERLRGYYVDGGTRADVFESVRSLQPARPRDFHDRVAAVTAFLQLPEAESLAAANKRIRNILRQAKHEGAGKADPRYLSEPAEQRLATSIHEMTSEVEPLIAARDYSRALRRLATLQPVVDGFFDDVMVMTDDDNVRNNRLALLSSLSNLFRQIADISHINTKA